jgi:hypothetical protein
MSKRSAILSCSMVEVSKAVNLTRILTKLGVMTPCTYSQFSEHRWIISFIASCMRGGGKMNNKWRIVEHNKGRITLLDEHSHTIADNEPYYPHALELSDAKRICSTMNYFDELLRTLEGVLSGEEDNSAAYSLIYRIKQELGDK